MPNYVGGTILDKWLKFRVIVNDCWRWNGNKSHNGYANVAFNGRKERLIRVVMHILTGFDLRSKLVIRHIDICRFKDCWNPEHIIVGTHKDNSQDWASKITHCPNGHEYNIHNTQYRKKTDTGHGGRRCRICEKIKARIRRKNA